MTQIIEEVTKLFPIEIDSILVPHTIEDIQNFLKKYPWKISVWWGRYSMGWQTAVIWGAQIDMRQMNRIIHFSPEEKKIIVETWVIWRDIQDLIDPHNLSIMTMQTYSNFTVWGSLSVNVHGRYIGFWPIILSVHSIRVVLASGELIEASRMNNSDIFYGAIGGYGGIGVIVEATLELRENTILERVYEDMNIEMYGDFFHTHIRDNKDIIFHNADIYPPHYAKVRATSWKNTEKAPTRLDRLIPRNTSYTLHQKVYNFMTNTYGPISHTDYGKWAREHLIDPILYKDIESHSRNYEASYDVAELEPRSRKENTYVLEEYFCPVGKINEFVPKMRDIFQRYNANIINVSIRHALPDDGSLLAWAKEEVFAFVVYYNQKTSISARREVAVWTRELIDAAISVGGWYYLPYQLHGSLAQVKKAYPRFDEYCELKKKYDPNGKLSNSLLEKYYFESDPIPGVLASRFHTVYSFPEWRDKFYLFLQNIFHIAPTALIHSAVWDIVDSHISDKDIYESIQKQLPNIKPLFADVLYWIPALWKQKQEITQQAKLLLGDIGGIDGYLEIWGAGRYIQPMKRCISITWSVYLISDEPIDHSPVRILERGQIGQYNAKGLTYTPADFIHIPDASLELITIFIGLHHCPLEQLDEYIKNIARKLKPSGHLILRDHNIENELMYTFVAIAHDIYNAWTGTSWEKNKQELRHFRSVADWKKKLQEFWFTHSGECLLQDNDPTNNTLMHFIRK